jgi:hypothetical protein
MIIMTDVQIANNFDRSQWQREPIPGKPDYECPNCKQLSMQSFAKVPDHLERTNSFFCCACGSSWEM